jgi:hypothetical protein
MVGVFGKNSKKINMILILLLLLLFLKINYILFNFFKQIIFYSTFFKKSNLKIRASNNN